MEKNKLIGWIAALIVVAVALVIVCFLRGERHKFGLVEFVNLALALFGIISSVSLINLGFTSSQLITLLGTDIITLFVGATAVIWVSIQQILQIFDPGSKLLLNKNKRL